VPLVSIYLKNIAGLQFFKSMVSGSGAGFAAWPDFGPKDFKNSELPGGGFFFASLN
jgi:hypothetical protein